MHRDKLQQVVPKKTRWVLDLERVYIGWYVQLPINHSIKKDGGDIIFDLGPFCGCERWYRMSSRHLHGEGQPGLCRVSTGDIPVVPECGRGLLGVQSRDFFDRYWYGFPRGMQKLCQRDVCYKLQRLCAMPSVHNISPGGFQGARMPLTGRVLLLFDGG